MEPVGFPKRWQSQRGGSGSVNIQAGSTIEIRNGLGQLARRVLVTDNTIEVPTTSAHAIPLEHGTAPPRYLSRANGVFMVPVEAEAVMALRHLLGTDEIKAGPP